ncbi:unnamed protein product [Clonostachys rosea]|uniref:Major facilitator superfamily (MFS) profile domain-containing protein n=1 Tax=Bionectria ochroleuca TaxID=29856 RepID=A0ABY6UFS4_BIOOC|nr:unnamed protein product [Clonostachys rosea]
MFGIIKLIAAITCTFFLVDLIGRKRSLLIGISLQAISMIYVGGVWVWFSLPETAGRTLENIDFLLALPWYRIGLHGNRGADELDRAVDEKMEIALGAQGEKSKGAETTGKRTALHSDYAGDVGNVAVFIETILLKVV